MLFGKEKKKQALVKTGIKINPKPLSNVFILQVENSENNWRTEGIKMPCSRWTISESGKLALGGQLSIHILYIRAVLSIGHKVVGDTINWVIK